MKSHIKYQPESFEGWYQISTTNYLRRPQGYYFYDEREEWCYGPFATAADADKGLDAWLGMPDFTKEQI
jgi:hypothetical protein